MAGFPGFATTSNERDAHRRFSFDLQCEICRRTGLSLYEFACQFTVHRKATVEYRADVNAIVITPVAALVPNIHSKVNSTDQGSQTGPSIWSIKNISDVIRRDHVKICSVAIKNEERSVCDNRVQHMHREAMKKLNLNQLKVTNDEGFSCDVCQKSYKWKCDLAKHVSAYHASELLFGSSAPAEKKTGKVTPAFGCPKCPNKRYMWRHDLRKHIRRVHPNATALLRYAAPFHPSRTMRTDAKTTVKLSSLPGLRLAATNNKPPLVPPPIVTSLKMEGARTLTTANTDSPDLLQIEGKSVCPEQGGNLKSLFAKTDVLFFVPILLLSLILM